MRKKLSYIALLLMLTVLATVSCGENVSPSIGENGACTDKHADADNNGLCDVCQADVTVEIDLYAINDLHGKFLDSESQPGVDEMTTYLKSAVTENENTFIFSSGDMWQGSAESGLTHGKIITEWMNHLDFEFMTLGNHEFDWGPDPIRENRKLADFPILAINVYDEKTNQRADFCEPSLLTDLGDVQIGFIGAIGDCYSSISSERSEGYYFLVKSELTELVKTESEKLRAAGADIIVYSLHDSTEGYDLSLSSGGYVDIVFEGHSHSKYVTLDKHGVYHLQGSGDNRGISHAEFSYNTANGQKKVEAAKVIQSSTYSAVEDDSIVDTLSSKYADELTILQSDLGHNDVQRNSGFLTDLVAKTYASLAEEKWSGYDVVLGGGKLSCRSPGKLYAGSVGYDDLYMLFPFDNSLALCSIKGSDLKSRYIDNGEYNVFYTPYGESVKNSIDPDKTYYIITDSYNFYYSANRLTVVEHYDQTTYARDLLARYIKNGGLTSGNIDPDSVLTPDKEYSVKELVEFITSLPQGAVSPGKYYVTGKITSIESTKYGNCYIEDANGDTLYIYGLKKDGNRYDSITQKPQVGDTVKLYGTVQHYVDKNGKVIPEMVNAEIQ